MAFPFGIGHATSQVDNPHTQRSEVCDIDLEGIASAQRPVAAAAVDALRLQLTCGGVATIVQHHRLAF